MATALVPGVIPKTLTFTLDGNDVSGTVTSAVITVADNDRKFVPFGANSSKKYTLEFTAAQDYFDEESLASLAYASPGTQIPYSLVGEDDGGNQVTFAGTVVVSEADGKLFGGDMDTDDTARFDFDAKWLCTAKPTIVRTAAV